MSSLHPLFYYWAESAMKLALALEPHARDLLPVALLARFPYCSQRAKRQRVDSKGPIPANGGM